MDKQIQTAEDRKKLQSETIERYLNSGLTQRQFCQQEQIAYSTFQLWLRKYRQADNSSKGLCSDKFVSLRVPPPEQLDLPHTIFHYPNGLVVHVHGVVSPQTLMMLIRAS